LENQETIALFPEAAHSGRRQMLPHKKAIPRIALEAEAKNNFNLNLQIIPVGIYYSHYWEFNRSLIVEYGQPICISKYRDEYTENPQKALLSLRDEIQIFLRPLTLQIDSINNYDSYEAIRQLAGESFAQSKKTEGNKFLGQVNSEKLMMNNLFHLETNHLNEFNDLQNSVNSYFNSLKKEGVHDIQVRKANQSNWLKLLMRLFLMVLSTPLFVFGFVFNALPFFLPRLILKKKVKNRTFLSTFNFGFGLILFP
jgi:hypothetical protein